MPRADRLWKILAAIAFVMGYGALLGWLTLGSPAHDEARVQQYMDHVRARMAPPLEPLPMVRVAETTELAMQRDPFEPLRARTPDEALRHDRH